MLASYPTTNYAPSLKVKAAALLEWRARHEERVVPAFDDWLAHVTPTFNWQWRHLVHIRGALDLVTHGHIDRLMLFVPPRHGKSSMVTVRYPAWRLERDPQLNIICGAYNQTLANRFSRQSRRIVRGRIGLDLERSASEEWQTSRGGTYRAVGVGGGITGHGADLIIIDDPVKSREEANSEAYREAVWDWYRDDLYTRREPGAAIVLIQTRWHEDDLAGRILASEDGPNWTVVSLPAEAEADDPLGRQPGEALCPERYSEADLAGIHRVLGNSYYALYQQRPTAPEGDMFKRYWFEIVGAGPAKARRIRYWDKAGTKGGGAYTCGVLMARAADRQFYVEDVVRGQWSADQRERMIRQTAELDRQHYGVVTVWVEQEPGSGGKESAEATIRNLAGFRIQADRVTGDKVARAEPYAAQCGAGNVKLVKAPWNAGYLDRLASFPHGKYADDVDASSGAFNKLAEITATSALAQAGARGWN